MPDAMAIVVELALRDEAFGRAWIIPGSGPLSAARAAAIAGRHLGREVKLRTAPAWLLRLLALFSPELREIAPMLPHYARPLRFNSSRLRALLGDPPVTPCKEAIPATLDWIARR